MDTISRETLSSSAQALSDFSQYDSSVIIHQGGWLCLQMQQISHSTTNQRLYDVGTEIGIKENYKNEYDFYFFFLKKLKTMIAELRFDQHSWCCGSRESFIKKRRQWHFY